MINKKNLPTKFLQEIEQSLKEIKGWGSVEIFVQDHKIIQITHRSIRKTNHVLR